MWINYTTNHLTFSITLKDFKDVNDRAKAAIDWAYENSIYLEGWQFSLYALFFCALLQYHSYTRTRLPATLRYLHKCKDIMNRIAIPSCFARTKLADLIELLCTTASEYPTERSAGNDSLNPIPGVKLRAKHPDLKWEAEQQAFVGNADVEQGELPIPENLVGSPSEERRPGEGLGLPYGEVPDDAGGSGTAQVEDAREMMDADEGSLMAQATELEYSMCFPGQWENFGQHHPLCYSCTFLY